MPANWFRCVCGFMMEAKAEFGDSVVSMHHLHKDTRLDGSFTIVRMEEIRDPAPEREVEVACAVGSLENHHAVPAAQKPHPRPRRRAA